MDFKLKAKLPPVGESKKESPKKSKFTKTKSRFINTIDFQNGEDSLFTPFKETAEQSFIVEKSLEESKQTTFQLFDSIDDADNSHLSKAVPNEMQAREGTSA